MAGAKGRDVLTCSQFLKLSKYRGMTNTNVLKAHYDIIYKNMVRKNGSSQMDLNCFFDALEELGNRLFLKKEPLFNLKDVLGIL